MRAQVKSIGSASSGSVDSIAFGQQIFTRTGYYRVRTTDVIPLRSSYYVASEYVAP